MAPIKAGKISDIQLESVVYAGQSHNEILPDGNRRGYFIGDGTGVGKGRESPRYFGIIGGKVEIKGFGYLKRVPYSMMRKEIRRYRMGLWCSDESEQGESRCYNNGRQRHPVHHIRYAEGQTRNAEAATRLEQIVNWLGKDFDGVIAFDESHNMGNALRA